MEVSPDKLQDVQAELQTWLLKTTARRKEVESLVGKLQFLAKCVKAGRTFLGRLIQWIRTMDRRDMYPVPLEARKDSMVEQVHTDLQWSLTSLAVPTIDKLIATDACPKGYGGTMENEYFRGRFPKELQDKNIAVLEIWAVMAALKLWGNRLAGKYFWIHVDNEAVATVLNSGKGRNTELQDAMREIAFIAAKHQFVIRARHIPGVTNRIPDWLSRWHENTSRKEFRQYARDKGLIHRRVSNTILHYQHNW